MPKHLEDSARADEAISAKIEEHQVVGRVFDDKKKSIDIDTKESKQQNKTDTKQVHFEESYEADTTENDDNEQQYDSDYNYNEVNNFMDFIYKAKTTQFHKLVRQKEKQCT